jgi:hypothetical protein
MKNTADTCVRPHHSNCCDDCQGELNKKGGKNPCFIPANFNIFAGTGVLDPAVIIAKKESIKKIFKSQKTKKPYCEQYPERLVMDLGQNINDRELGGGYDNCKRCKPKKEEVCRQCHGGSKAPLVKNLISANNHK